MSTTVTIHNSAPTPNHPPGPATDARGKGDKWIVCAKVAIVALAALVLVGTAVAVGCYAFPFVMAGSAGGVLSFVGGVSAFAASLTLGIVSFSKAVTAINEYHLLENTSDNVGDCLNAITEIYRASIGSSIITGVGSVALVLLWPVALLP